ncbi:hypothetical protein [Prevotella corporis]|uniref:hypothetical protein n=1 Tax=Prevotella corporis TaxID=28128 RepID=UPI0023F11C9E|nr:hypothetical protein [Prevotella corporis]
MMKTKTLFLAMGLMLIAGVAPAQAQGLGGLLKKAKKVVEAVTGTEKTPAVQGYETTNAPLSKVTIASGGYMINPLSKAMDVELVGCYGKGKSVNFGDVYLVLKVKMNLVKETISIGNTAGKGKCLAIDADGNQYFHDNDANSVSVAEGMFVRINLNDGKYNQHFVNVPKKVKVLPLIKLGFYIDGSQRDMIEFRDVPVQWDVEP